MDDYKKGGHGLLGGGMYQSKLLALCLLRGLADKQDFSLATEMVQDEVGKYDDVVFFFNDKKGKRRTFLLQAKHTWLEMDEIQNPKKQLFSQTFLSVIDNDFALAQYFYSYLEKIKGNLELAHVDGLVLFTNRTVDGKSMAPHLIKLKDDDREFLRFCRNTKCGDFYSLTEEFVSTLKPSVMKYYLSVICRKLLRSLLSDKKLELYWANSTQRLESSIYCHIFDFTLTDDGTVVIAGFKQEFIDGNKETLNGTCWDFREIFIQQLREKWDQNPIQKEITKKGSACNLGQFNLMNFSKLILTFSIKVEGHRGVHTKRHVKNLSVDKLISKADLARFQELFVIAVGQPNVHQIEEILKDALRQHAKLPKIDSQFVLTHLLPHIYRWLDSKRGTFLNENKASEILNTIYLQFISASAKICDDNGCLVKTSFMETRLTDLDNLLKNNDDKCMEIRVTESTKLFILQLQQIAFAEQFLFIKLKFLIEIDIDIVAFLKQSNSFTGIVVDVTSFVNSKRHLDIIEKLLLCEKRVIFVAPCNTAIDRMLSDRCGCVMDAPITKFEHLSWESQEFLLSKEIIDCHGRMYSLKDFLTSIDLTNIGDGILNDLMVRAPLLAVGSVPSSLSTLLAAYSRVRCSILPNVFMKLLSNDHYKFAVSERSDLDETEASLVSFFMHGNHCNIVMNNITSEDNIDTNKNIILFRDNDLEKFHSICKKIEKKVVFWIRIESKTLNLFEIYNPHYYVKRRLQFTQVNFPTCVLDKYLKGDNTNKSRCFIISYVFYRDLSKFGLINVDRLYKSYKKKGNHTKKKEKRIRKSKNYKIRELNSVVFLCYDKEGEQLFTSKCDQYKEVHWLKLHHDKLIWIKSHGSIDFLRENESEIIRELKTYKEKIFFDEVFVENQAVIISDEAGTGKSTTLVSMCNELMATKCVYMVDLKDDTVQKCLDTLAKTQIGELECIMKLFSSIRLNANLETRKRLLTFLLINLLRSNYEEINALVLIFDGFDEISQKYQEAVIKIITFILNKTSCRICITTRNNYCKRLLEDKLLVLATTFKDVSRSKQKKILIECWKRHPYIIHSTQFSNDVLSKVAEKVLKHISIFFHGIPMFVRQPLYLRLISETILRHDVEGYITESAYTNVAGIFDEFIKKRYELCFTGKNESLVKYLAKSFNDFHAKLAFQILFPSDSQELGLDAQKKIAEEANTCLSIGHVYLNRSGHFEFIHQTFCEYYCAMYLDSCLKNHTYNNSLYKKAISLLRQDWFWPCGKENGSITLVSFLNAMIFKDLEDDVQNEIEAGIDLVKTDRLGRTFEHRYALVNEVYDADKADCLLMISKVDLHGDGFDRTPLHYASNSIKDMILLSFEFHSFYDNFRDSLLYRSLNDWEETPHTVYSGVAAFESSKWKEIVNAKDCEQRACLYYAAELRNWEVCAYLLLHGADCRDLNKHQRLLLLEYMVSTHIKRVNGELDAYNWVFSPEHAKHWTAITLLLYNDHDLLKEFFPLLLITYLSQGHISVAEKLFSLCSSEEKSDISRVLKSFCGIFEDCYCCYLTDGKYLQMNRFLSENGILHNYYKSIENFSSWGHIETVKYLINSSRDLENISFHKCIRQAIKYNQKSVVEYLWLTHGKRTTDEHGTTALMVASYYGKLSFVKYFCENGSDINFKNASSQTALQIAAQYFHLDVIKYLLVKGAHVTCIYHGPSLVDVILDAFRQFTGYSIDIFTSEKEPYYVDVEQCEQFSMRIEYHHAFECLKYLVLDCKMKSRRVPLEVFEDMFRATSETVNIAVHSTTLLHKAVNAGEPALMKYALAIGGDPDVKDDKGSTTRSKTVSLEKLINKIFNFDPGNSNGDTLLHIEARQGSTANVEKLITTGALFDKTNKKGKTPAECLPDDSDCEIFSRVAQYFKKVRQNDIKYIVAINKDLARSNYRDKFGMSLLHCAVIHGYSDVADYLLTCGADTEFVDYAGYTPLYYAIESNSLIMTHLLLKHAAVYNPGNLINSRSILDIVGPMTNSSLCVTWIRIIRDVFRSTQQSQFNAALRILKSIDSDAGIVSAVISARDVLHHSLLHHAAACGSLDVVKFILCNGGRYDSINGFGETPMDVTRSPSIYILLAFIRDLKMSDLVEYPQLEKIFLECILNATNESGDTCLHRVECVFVAKWLIKNSSNINVPNKFGNTPLMMALNDKRDAVARLLLKKGARTDTRDMWGRSIKPELLARVGWF